MNKIQVSQTYRESLTFQKMKLLNSIFIIFIDCIICQNITQPLIDAIDTIFTSKNIPFDLIIYGRSSAQINDIADQILKGNKEFISVHIKVIEPTSWDHKLSKSAVFLMSRLQFLLYLHVWTKVNSQFYNPLKILIYCEEMESKDLEKLYFGENFLEFMEGHKSYYQYFLIDAREKIELITIEWFTPIVCNKMTFIVLNAYYKKSKKWNEELVIPEKFKNFYSCMLVLYADSNYLHTYFDLTGKPKGPMIDLFEAMGSRANFTYNYQKTVTRSDGTHDMIPKNNIVLNANIFFQIKPFIYSNFAPTIEHFSTLFHEQKISFALTESQSYTSYEKLTRPFDLLTWIYLITTFICAFLSIFLLSFIPKKFQILVYGKNVVAPALNVVSIFFGISQPVLPFQNFPRIILVTFMVFCLVFRTAYQGVLFDMIASDIRKPLPKTIDDLYEMNYTINLCEDIYFTENLFPEKLR